MTSTEARTSLTDTKSNSSSLDVDPSRYHRCIKPISSSVSSTRDEVLVQMRKLMEKQMLNKILMVMKMLGMGNLPISSLLVVVLVSLALNSAVTDQQMAKTAHASMDEVVRLGTLVSSLQLERGSSAWYLSSNDQGTWNRLVGIWKQTDVALAALYQWPSGMHINNISLPDRGSFQILLSVYRSKLSTNGSDINDLILLYTEMTTTFMDWSTKITILPDIEGFWMLATALDVLARATDSIGLKHAFGLIFFSSCKISAYEFSRFLIEDRNFQAYRDLAFTYQPQIRPAHDRIYSGSILEMNISRDEAFIRELYHSGDCWNSTGIDWTQLSIQWQADMSTYFGIIVKLRLGLINQMLADLSSYSSNSKTTYNILMILTTICFGLCIWFTVLFNQNVSKMVDYAVMLKTISAELAAEKKHADELLYQMLPREVAHQLMRKEPVTATQYDSVTIYFSDIVGFTDISSQSSPLDIVNMLNDLYSGFDELIERFEVYKVETIGDAYMVAGGVPKMIEDHAAQVAHLSLRLMTFVNKFTIRHMPEESLLLRIGLHSGSVVAGVVGHKMPRYCLFGDTVNTASRMESNSLSGRIHISETTKIALDQQGHFDVQFRDTLMIKGKGPMQTYWLLGTKDPSKSAESN